MKLGFRVVLAVLALSVSVNYSFAQKSRPKKAKKTEVEKSKQSETESQPCMTQFMITAHQEQYDVSSCGTIKLISDYDKNHPDLKKRIIEIKDKIKKYLHIAPLNPSEELQQVKISSCVYSITDISQKKVLYFCDDKIYVAEVNSERENTFIGYRIHRAEITLWMKSLTDLLGPAGEQTKNKRYWKNRKEDSGNGNVGF